ncbi:MAG: hypothetical protein VX446_02250 [Bacteroidota bacterium]|nr:hypothetical protein [Bacteroidota bacterium]
MDNRNTSLFLFSAVFLLLGFLLGRVTAPPPHGPHAKMKGPATCDPSGLADEFVWVSEDAEDVQIMVVSDEAFEGDTAFALPGGGTVNVIRNGEEMEVEVDMDALMEDAEKRVTVTREEAADGSVRVEKRVIVVRDED